MDLSKYFTMQKQLDQHIVKGRSLEGVSMIQEKILALYTELGELANELPEIFKFWSGKKNNYEKALKEYVDVMHFLLSVGLDLRMDFEELCVGDQYADYTAERPVETFNKLFECVSEFGEVANYGNRSDLIFVYEVTLNVFLGLGEKHLHFTLGQIESAYFEKNQINHKRQESGY